MNLIWSHYHIYYNNVGDFMMKRKGRKEITIVGFKGVLKNGSFMFLGTVFSHHLDSIWRIVPFQVLSYQDGIMEIVIDSAESISKVAEFISGMFSKKSNLYGLDFVICHYRHIHLRISKHTGRKNIISMLIKALITSSYDASGAFYTIDAQICQIDYPLRNSDDLRYEVHKNSFQFDELSCFQKDLWFIHYDSGNIIRIPSIQNGIISINFSAGNLIPDLLAQLKMFFTPYSNFYGVKAIENVELNEFTICVDSQNVDNLFYLFNLGLDMKHNLWERELEEYCHSREYMIRHAKFLKKECRKNRVLQKIKDFHSLQDFTLVKGKTQAEWRKYITSSPLETYIHSIVEYAILLAQYVEYLMHKHHLAFANALDIGSKEANVFGITLNMHSFAVYILSMFWKYGEELRLQYNAKYHYEGTGVVNPAIFSLAV